MKTKLLLVRWYASYSLQSIGHFFLKSTFLTAAPIIMMTRPAFLGSALSLYLKSVTPKESACVRANQISPGGHSRPLSQVSTASGRCWIVDAHLEKTPGIGQPCFRRILQLRFFFGVIT